MKTLFPLILFSFLLGTATAQTKLYKPKELKEDADQYFTFLSSTHPDQYYFCSANEFNKIKNNIYSELNKPLSKTDFILTMAQINSCIDAHSTIPVDSVLAEMLLKSITKKMKEAAFPFLRDSIDAISFQNFTIGSFNEFLKERNINADSIMNSIYLLPIVEIRENELFFLGDSINNIIEINGILTKTMLSEANKYINLKLNPKSNSYLLNQYINAIIIGKYNINSPFRIKFGSNKREETMKGITLTEWRNEFPSIALASISEYYNPLYTYEIYPANSVAIFHIQTFVIKYREDFLNQIEKFKKEVNKEGIKYIFYDLSMNVGGNHYGVEALDIIKHDTVYLKYTKTSRIDAGIKNKRIKEIVLLPNPDNNNIPDDRILFVLQSAITASGADYFCRIVAENKLGILVGEPTGELTKTFSYSKEFTMPNTGIHYNMATTLVDYSDFFESLTTPPDIYWDLKNIKEFTEQELLNIINCYKNRKTCITE